VGAISDNVVRSETTRHVGNRYGAFAAGCSFTRLCLPLVVLQYRRLYGLLVHLHVALPCAVNRSAVVYHVGHVMCHVVASRTLLLGEVLALFHAEDSRQSLDRNLQTMRILNCIFYKIRHAVAKVDEKFN